MGRVRNDESLQEDTEKRHRTYGYFVEEKKDFYNPFLGQAYLFHYCKFTAGKVII